MPVSIENLENIAILLSLALVACAVINGSEGIFHWGRLLTPTTLLSLSLFLVTALYVMIVEYHWAPGKYARAVFFVVLYFWCVMGMFFFASTYAKSYKMYTALAVLAGVMFSLYRMTV